MGAQKYDIVFCSSEDKFKQNKANSLTISFNANSNSEVHEKKLFLAMEKEPEDPEASTGSRKRAEWSNPIEFLFSCLALSVGLGNVWRFPFTAYKNGGGAFLIPYLVVLFLIGKPIYFLELTWGQFSAYGQIKAWKVVPLLKGVGFGELIASICGGSYYCAIMAITIFYLIKSFSSILPWTVCEESWAGPCTANGTTLLNSTLPELYFEREVVKELDSINDGIGSPSLTLTLCLLAVWTLIFFTLIKGIKSSGKVAYFTALFPYFVLIILLIRGVTLPGSWEGIRYFIEPQWGKLWDINVWYAAISQCFFSLSTGFGAIIMNASYNPFRHNIYRDAFIISLMDTFTSLLAGFTIFATLGNLALELDVDISNVVKSGPGLAFVSYPDAIAKFSFAPQFFAVMFFLMLLTLGVGTAIGMANGIITVVCDAFPTFKRIVVTVIVCTVGFLIGLIYVTPGGQFLITLVDFYGAGSVIYVMVTLEVIGIAWIYGVSNFCLDIEFMLNIKIGWYWRICWGFIVPVSLISILGYTLITSTTLTHNDNEFPAIALVSGWTLSAVAVLIVPIIAIQVLFSQKGSTFKKKLISAVTPSSGWGPKDPIIRREWITYKSNASLK